MKIFKKKWFWIILIIILIGGIGYALANKNQKKGPEYTTAKVTRGKLIQTVSATGAVESATEIELNFKVLGKINNLSVKVGDKVKAGQLLATLDAGSASSKVANNQAAVAVAQANLDKVLAGSSNQDISVSEQEVASAQATLASKNNNLINLQNTSDIAMANLRETAINNLNNKYFIGQSSLQTIYDTINYNPPQPTFDIINNGAVLAAVNQNYPLAVDNLDNMQNYIDQAEQNKTNDNIILAADNLKEALTEISSLADQTYQVLQSTITSSNLTLTELNTLKTNITTVQTNLITAINVLQTDRNNILNTQQDYDSKVAAAQDEVETAQAALALAEAKLDLKKAGPRDFEISLYQAQLQQAQANLQQAYSDLADYTLRSPTNGTITKINTEKGEQTSAANPVMVMMAESNLQIEVDIPESDITKVQIANLVSVTLDAFGEDRKFSGTITFIDPAATIIQDVVYYKVKVSFNDEAQEVKPGMTANIDIVSNEKVNVLMVPARAIKEIDNKKIVQILSNGTPSDREVTTGIKGDEAMVEIISGLNEGEEVVTFIKNGN